jgi:Domain of unknown function (DUF3332).
MKHSLKNVVCVLLVGVMFATSFGCYGSFNLTKQVWRFNGGVGDKWVNELVFLVMNIVPVYGASVFVDAILFNSIEFWSGKNPITGENALPNKFTGDDGTSVTLNTMTKEIEIARPIPGNAESVYRLVRENGQSVVKDKDGNILVRCFAGDDGGMTLLDAQGKVLQTYSPAQVEALTMR